MWVGVACSPSQPGVGGAGPVVALGGGGVGSGEASEMVRGAVISSPDSPSHPGAGSLFHLLSLSIQHTSPVCLLSGLQLPLFPGPSKPPTSPFPPPMYSSPSSCRLPWVGPPPPWSLCRWVEAAATQPQCAGSLATA